MQIIAFEASGLSQNAYPPEALAPGLFAMAGPGLERSSGKAMLEVMRGAGGAHEIRDLAQSGCARLLFPARRAADPLEAVIANIGGGLTGGDSFLIEGHLGPGAQAVFTTQAAEKIYRSDGAITDVETRLSAGDGSLVHWLPQETILFEGGSLSRRLEVDLGEGATALLAESLLLGRAAMGEQLATARLSDSWRIRRGKRLVFAEETRVDGGWAEAFERKAALGPGVVGFATVVLAASNAETQVAGLRAIVAGFPVEAGVSAFDGLLVMRMLSDSGLALRRAMTASLEHLAGRALPRIWRT